MAYAYELLIPTSRREPAGSGAAGTRPSLFGVEVTDPALAETCGLGNLDPQHTGGDATTAAVEAALIHPLPPSGAVLGTIRPDADAYGAMALLSMRAEGREIGEDARRRLLLIAAEDKFARGSWPGPRPMPLCLEDVDEVGPGPEALGALKAQLGQRGLAAGEGVAAVRGWIETGIVAESWVEAARSAARRLWEMLRSGEVRVWAGHGGRVAMVEGAAPGVLRLGYRLAPVVIAEGLMPKVEGSLIRKVTIAQYQPGIIDLIAAVRTLNAIEPGWGGSPTIVGSPQGDSTRIRTQEVLRAVVDTFSLRSDTGENGGRDMNEAELASSAAGSGGDVWTYLFEAKGIQRYIFDSGPLRDLIGASDLVAGLTVSQETETSEGDLIEDVLAALRIERDAIGFSRRAGGAFCAHARDRAVLDRFRALWALAVSLRCPGLETSDSGPVFAGSDIDGLRAAYKGGSGVRSNQAAELPPTAHPVIVLNARTGRVATSYFVYKAGELTAADVVTRAQRIRAQELQGATSDRAQEPRDERSDRVARRFLGDAKPREGRTFVFPRNLDPEEGDTTENPLFPFLGDGNDRRIAVIHADLSGLGEVFQRVTRAADAAMVLEVATAIERAIERAAQEAVQKILLPEAECRDGDSLAVIPARPVVLGGDDLTIIVRADLALPFTQELLKNIETKTRDAFAQLRKIHPELELQEYLSACAGIAIGHAARPFLMAHGLADTLCKFAKQKAKAGGEAPYPSALAFHNAQSTLHEDYERDVLPAMTADVIETTGDSPPAAGTRMTGNPYLVVSGMDAGPGDWRRARDLMALAKELAKAPRGRGKLIETAQALYGNEREAKRLWDRWRLVVDEEQSGSLKKIDEALERLGIKSPEKNLRLAIGPLSDALELIDLRTPLDEPAMETAP